jgi:transcriptional regulator with PAS, ATPase and Fis domain
MALVNSTVLVSGETGTGKELVARALHDCSDRSCKPFVSVNCAAIPDLLLESELFGHEKGAYTGADSRSDGRLNAAEGGTVFLDEIGELTLMGQAKILRVIEAREIQRVGGRTPIRVDIRIVAATNRDLWALVRAGNFRKDLFFRLSVLRIHVPELRTRKEDIVPLFAYFANSIRGEDKENHLTLTEGATHQLIGYSWPGNIRELRNVTEALCLLQPRQVPVTDRVLATHLVGTSSDEVMDPGEKGRILAALESTSWNKTRTAKALEWSRMTLYRKLIQYGLSCKANGRDVT